MDNIKIDELKKEYSLYLGEYGEYICDYTEGNIDDIFYAIKEITQEEAQAIEDLSENINRNKHETLEQIKEELDYDYKQIIDIVAEKNNLI